MTVFWLFWQILLSYCKFLIPRPLKWGILGAGIIILSGDIHNFILCMVRIFMNRTLVKFEIPDQKFRRGEPEPVLNTLLSNRIYYLKGPSLFADSYSVFKRRLWQLKTTKTQNIFSFSSYWQNREPKVCSTNIWHSLFFTYNKIEIRFEFQWPLSCYHFLLDFGCCDWFVFMKFT